MVEWNRLHLGQVKGTLFKNSEIVKYIGKNGCAKGADDVLNGKNTYHYLQLTALQKEYFTQLQYDKRYIKSNIRDTTTKEDLKIGYKKWRESTSTSSSGRYLGNYKVLLVIDGINNSEVNTFTEKM